ncbi:hypothetical protein [Rhizobium leguminosarum]
MKSSVPPKSLKDQIRWQLWLTIAANFALFYVVAQSDAFAVSGVSGLLTGAANLLPVGLALIVTTIANGLLDASMKARLVFLRWNFALPGHRAFSVYAVADPRVDVARLRESIGELPNTPADENLVWYRLYKKIEADPAVTQIHREFLFTRDYAAFSFLFLLGFGVAALFLISEWKVALLYLLALIGQFIVVRHAAANYGVRLVSTVLAQSSARPRKEHKSSNKSERGRHDQND